MEALPFIPMRVLERHLPTTQMIEILLNNGRKKKKEKK